MLKGKDDSVKGTLSNLSGESKGRLRSEVTSAMGVKKEDLDSLPITDNVCLVFLVNSVRIF